jgi:hypothetical protein
MDVWNMDAESDVPTLLDAEADVPTLLDAEADVPTLLGTSMHLDDDTKPNVSTLLRGSTQWTRRRRRVGSALSPGIHLE